MDSGLDAAHRPGMTKEKTSTHQRPPILLIPVLADFEDEMRRCAG
jgi:hypothetical protein